MLIVAAYVALAGWGWWALSATPIDAIPDLSDNQVIVFTEWPGHGPQEVEDQVTYPLTVNLQGLPGVRVVRSQSAFGFSMIYVVFDDDVDLYFARTRVLERLSLVSKTLCRRDATPTLGPTPPEWATCSGTRSRATPLAARPAQPAGLVHPLSAQRSAGRGRSGIRWRHTCSNTRSTSIRTGCAPTACR